MRYAQIRHRATVKSASMLSIYFKAHGITCTFHCIEGGPNPMPVYGSPGGPREDPGRSGVGPGTSEGASGHPWVVPGTLPNMLIVLFLEIHLLTVS